MAPRLRVSETPRVLEHFVETYGYVAILVGTFFEGETVLILGGFLAHRGYVALPGVMVAAFVGTLAGDQLYFQLGRRYHSWLLVRRPEWAERVEILRTRLERHQYLVLLGYRFVYGIRTLTPFAVGVSRIPWTRFLAFELVSGSVWAITVGTLGYFVGEAFSHALHHARRYEAMALATIVTGGAIAWAIAYLRQRRLAARAHLPPPSPPDEPIP